MIAAGLNPAGTKFLVREIVGYLATRVFHAPVTWPDASDYSAARLPGETDGYSATLTSELKNYLKCKSRLGQFAQDPGLREAVEKIEKQSAKTKSTYLVVEESGEITDCKMDQGECWPGPDSGRDGVVIIKTSGGAWPTFMEQVERDTALLVAMRTLTKVGHPFELYARSVCFLTDQGETAHPIVYKMSVAYGGVRVTKPVAGGKVSVWANRLGEVSERLVHASGDPAVNELLAAIRLDKAKDDEHFRLWYLRLWQALTDLGCYCQTPEVKYYLLSLKTQQQWRDLSEHRNAIAHWWTERVDYKKVSDLHHFAVEIAEYIVGLSQPSPTDRP
jgi:hypothetical protein